MINLWLARDGDGTLWLHFAEPVLKGGRTWMCNGADYRKLRRERFPDIPPGTCVRLVGEIEAKGEGDACAAT
jgi:hypothetical protein